MFSNSTEETKAYYANINLLDEIYLTKLRQDIIVAIIDCIGPGLINTNDGAKFYEMSMNASSKIPQNLYIYHFVNEKFVKYELIDVKSYFKEEGISIIDFETMKNSIGKNIAVINKIFKAEFCILQDMLCFKSLFESFSGYEHIKITCGCNECILNDDVNTLYYNNIREHFEDKYEYSDNKLMIYGVRDSGISFKNLLSVDEYEDTWRPILMEQGYKPIHILKFCVEYLGCESELCAKELLEAIHFIIE
jgi:hypothetical protein